MPAPIDEKIEFIRRLYRDESSFADNVKISQLREINIQTDVEKVIESLIKSNVSVILTGNAGDGKTHIIRLMERKLENQNAYIVQDASAENLEQVIKQWSESLQSGKPSCIAINEGPLLDLIKKYHKEYPFLLDVERQIRQSVYYVILDSSKANLAKQNWTLLQDAKGKVFVVDLSLRQNLSQQIASKILDKLTEERWYQGCTTCLAKSICGVTYNRMALSKIKIQEKIGKLLETVSLRGEQVTFREVMAFCSYLIFGGRSCDKLIELGNSELTRYYMNAFEGGDGKLFDELRNGCDPVSRTHATVDENLWRGCFSPDEFLFEPNPLPISLDSYSGKSDFDKNIEVFKALKRRWFFEHPDGEKLTPKTEAEEFFKNLRDTSQTSQSRVSELIRLLNCFQFPGDKNYPDGLRLWTQLAFSPRNKSKARVSGREIPSQALFLHEPRLDPLLEKCFGEQPVDHLLLGPEGKDFRFTNLRIDLRLLNLLLGIYGGVAEDPECTRRIDRFNDALANQIRVGGGDFRIVLMVEGRTREVRIRVDLRKRRYDGLSSDRS